MDDIRKINRRLEKLSIDSPVQEVLDRVNQLENVIKKQESAIKSLKQVVSRVKNSMKALLES